jgi:hypothetical protein
MFDYRRVPSGYFSRNYRKIHHFEGVNHLFRLGPWLKHGYDSHNQRVTNKQLGFNRIKEVFVNIGFNKESMWSTGIPAGCLQPMALFENRLPSKLDGKGNYR